MPEPRRTSAVYELDVTVYGGPTIPKESTKTILTTGSELIGPNPERVEYWITNNGPSTVYWSQIANPSATRGHSLGAGQVLTVRARDDGAFAIVRLYGVANGADSVVTITEIIRSDRVV